MSDAPRNSASTGPDDQAQSQAQALDRVKGLLAGAGRIAVLTGAGISTGAGIPDFRGPRGLFTTNPDALSWFEIDSFLADPEARRGYWSLRRPLLGAHPTPAHAALVDLERSGRLTAVITQNIDGLHQKAGNSPGLVLEAHGSVYGVRCHRCDATSPVQDVVARLDAGEDDPACAVCRGVLRPTVVMYGEPLDPQVMALAQYAASTCDVMVAVGSTLDVYPVALLPEVALASGAALVVVNLGPTSYDDRATVRVRGDASVVLPAILGTAAASS